jgi:hypothetical protein
VIAATTLISILIVTFARRAGGHAESGD